MALIEGLIVLAVLVCILFIVVLCMSVAMGLIAMIIEMMLIICGAIIMVIAWPVITLAGFLRKRHDGER